MDPGYFSLISCRGFRFLLNASSFGLQASWACHFFFFRGPLPPASLDLAYFLLGLAHFFGLGHCDPFRPQHLLYDNSREKILLILSIVGKIKEIKRKKNRSENKF